MSRASESDVVATAIANLLEAAQNRAMLSERPVPPDLTQRLEALVAAWEEYEQVAAVWLFGSRARGSAGSRSDVDLAVALRAGMTPDERWRARLELTGDASRRLGTDAVDVIVMEDAPTVLGHRVLRDGKLLCERDPHRRVAVAEEIVRNYLDDEYLRRVLDAELSRRLREGRALPVDAVLIRRLLRAMERSLRALRELRSRGRAAFVADEVVQDRVDRHAQLLAQACADIALHILTAKGGAAPETYADAMAGLGTLGIVPQDVIVALVGAVRLRNVLVHAYLEIDHGRIYDELDWIDRAEEFAVLIDRWLVATA